MSELANSHFYIQKLDFTQRRLTPNVTLFAQKDLNKNQQQENHIPHPLENLGNKAPNMLILEDTTNKDDDGNWVKSILREKERKINDCSFHDKCISTKQLKVIKKDYIMIR